MENKEKEEKSVKLAEKGKREEPEPVLDYAEEFLKQTGKDFVTKEYVTQ